VFFPVRGFFSQSVIQRGRKQKKDRKQKNSRKSQIQQEIVFQFVFIREIRG
jgi:hypothetical protein